MWKDHPIETKSPVEFAFLVDLDNDGKAREILPEFGDAKMPLTWYEARNGEFVRAQGRGQIVRPRHRRGRCEQGRPHRHHRAHKAGSKRRRSASDWTSTPISSSARPASSTCWTSMATGGRTWSRRWRTTTASSGWSRRRRASG